MKINFDNDSDLEELKEIIRGLTFEKDKAESKINAWLSEIQKRGILNYQANQLDTITISILSLLTEGYDQLGNFKQAMELSEKFAKDFLEELAKDRTLPTLIEKKRIAQRLLRQKIWLCFNYFHLLLRTDSLSEAENCINRCQRVIEDILLDDEENSATPFLLYGTRSRLHYYLSLYHLQKGQLPESKFHARESLIFASERFEQKRKKYEGDEIRLKREEARAKVCFAKVEAYNFARIARANGYTKIALQKLRIAKLILSKTKGSLVYEMLDAEIGITLTYIAGSGNIKLLKEANEFLRKSLLTLENKDFVYYVKEKIYLAENYLAQAKHFKNKNDSQKFDAYFDEANNIANKLIDELAKEAKEIANGIKDKLAEESKDKLNDLMDKLAESSAIQKKTKWRINLVHSQIYLEKVFDSNVFNLDSYEEARSLSRRAIQDTNELKHSQGNAFAFFLKGRIHLERYLNSDDEAAIKIVYLEKAIRAFKNSRENSSSNKLLKAYLSVFLAKCYRYQGRISDFSVEFEEYEEKYKGIISHAFFNEEASRLEQEILEEEKAFGDSFVIKTPINDFNFRKWELKLKKWLVSKAKREIERQIEEAKKKNKPIPVLSEKAVAKMLGYKSHNTIADLKKGR
jgi:hypothetical protein